MKRYFDLPSARLTCELNIENDSSTCTAEIDVFKKYFKYDDVRELTKKEYNELTKIYQSGQSNK